MFEVTCTGGFRLEFVQRVKGMHVLLDVWSLKDLLLGCRLCRMVDM